MWVQLFIIFVSFFYCLILLRRGDIEKNRRYFVIFNVILLILQSGLRNLAVGADTYAYSLKFESSKFVAWSEIWQNFYTVYVEGHGKDAGYYVLQKLFSTFCPFFRIYLLCVAAAFFIPLGRLLSKHLTSLPQLFVAFLLYQTLFYSFFSITGIRQTIATTATLFGIELILERKPLPFILIITLASFIHKSVLLFLPFYYIAQIPRSNILLFISLAAYPLAGLLNYARSFIHFMAKVSMQENYIGYAESTYETQGARGFLLFILLTAIIVLIAKQTNPEEIPDWLVNAIPLALFFTPFTWVDPSLMRIVQYFSIFTLLSLPISLEKIRLPEKQKIFMQIFFPLVFVFKIILTHAQYRFFWEYMELSNNYRTF